MLVGTDEVDEVDLAADAEEQLVFDNEKIDTVVVMHEVEVVEVLVQLEIVVFDDVDVLLTFLEHLYFMLHDDEVDLVADVVNLSEGDVEVVNVLYDVRQLLLEVEVEVVDVLVMVQPAVPDEIDANEYS